MISHNVRKFVVDLAERTVSTYLEVFVGLMIASKVIDFSVLKSAAIAAVPAGLAVIKGALSSQVGDSSSAAAVSVKP